MRPGIREQVGAERSEAQQGLGTNVLGFVAALLNPTYLLNYALVSNANAP